MRKRRFWAMSTLVSLFVILSLVLSACGATPTATPTKAAATATVAAKPTNTPVPAGPKKGGTVTMAVWQSPTSLNWELSTQTVVNVINSFMLEGLTDVQPDGSRLPNLAKEVPTVQNGGVSADGKTITYKLKEGIKWSDGTAFSCADLQYSLKAIMTPDLGLAYTTGYSEIASIDCPDPNTAVFKYKNFYAAYLVPFGMDPIYPQSAGDPKDMKNWAYNRKPIGTGPFKLDEWVADDHITMSRNPNYRDPNKPYLDKIIIRIVPSSEVAMQLLASGEVDIMWNNTEADIPQLEKMAGVKIAGPAQIGGERLFLNMAENKDPSDPKKPHLILGDVKVRQAIAYGINKQRIIDKLLNGKALPGSSELNSGYFNCTDIKAYPYDPAKAKQLLEEAGWVMGSDGIRVAKGAKYAPDGTRLRLKYATTSGNKLREDSQVLVVEDMKAIGVEFYIENAPSAVVIGSWDAGSPRRHGNFDIIMYTTNAGIDPHSQMMNLFFSGNIPSESNKGGTNYSRFNDPKADELLKQAGAEPDMAKRKALYCQVAQMGYDQANMIYLYQRLKLASFRDRVQGWTENAWNDESWDAENWYIK